MVDFMNDVAATGDDATVSSELSLHDETIQTLFGIGLKIEYSMLLFDEEPVQAKQGLDAALVQLTDLIVGLRDRIDDIK